jgi:hypothetical protein
MKISDLKVGDKLEVFVKTNYYKTINTLGDIIEITGITQDVNGTLWINHIPNSFSGGGFRIENKDSSIGSYKLGIDVILMEKKEMILDYSYLIKLFEKLNIK